MDRPYPPRPLEDPRSVLRRHGLRPKRSWGQNFLVNLPLVDRLADAVAEGGAEHVVEIGAGAGTLTAALAARFARVTAIERDRDLAALLRVELAELGNVELVEADAARFDFVAAAAGSRTAIAGNLPYNLTGRLLRAVTQAGASIDRAVVMVQREVGERLVAQPGSRAYGVLTVMTQAFLEPTQLFRLGPGSFYPKPNVDSAVLRLVPRERPRAGDVPEPSLARLVHSAFAARRKTLRNALGAAFPVEAVDEALSAEGIEPTIRAERLSVEQLASLAARLCPESAG